MLLVRLAVLDFFFSLVFPVFSLDEGVVRFSFVYCGRTLLPLAARSYNSDAVLVTENKASFVEQLLLLSASAWVS